jgi:hypothetical protein
VKIRDSGTGNLFMVLVKWFYTLHPATRRELELSLTTEDGSQFLREVVVATTTSE